MRKIIYTLLIMVVFSMSCNAETLLEGGITKEQNIDNARHQAFLMKPVFIIDSKAYSLYSTKAPSGYRVDYAGGGYSIASGNKIYRYYNGHLVVIGISNKNVMDFPRSVSYYEYPSGKLTSTTYGVNPDNGYIFLPNGNLLGIWENGVYFEKNKKTNSANVTFFN